MLYMPHITRSISHFPKQNGVHGLQNMSIYSIFKDEILKNCRFVEVPTSEFGLFIIYPNFLLCFQLLPKGGQRN